MSGDVKGNSKVFDPKKSPYRYVTERRLSDPNLSLSEAVLLYLQEAWESEPERRPVLPALAADPAETKSPQEAVHAQEFDLNMLRCENRTLAELVRELVAQSERIPCTEYAVLQREYIIDRARRYLDRLR